MRSFSCVSVVLLFGLWGVGAAQGPAPLAPADLHGLQSVGDVQLSPTGADLAYSVASNAGPGRPTSSTWLLDLTTGETVRLESGSAPRWSPDGQSIAYVGSTTEGTGLVVATRRGQAPRLIAPIGFTNHPLPSSGRRVAWSPDGKLLAFVSATAGPESEAADGDPMVITRYLFKPTAAEGLTRFNDNKRLHIFVADVVTRQVRQLTDGPYYEHSLDWSPGGDRILFLSNREPTPDTRFNYDIFTVGIGGGAVARLTETKSAEYFPAWSPDGTRIAFSGTTRDLTSSETTMEDTHVWVMRADGTERVEVGRGIDNRQGAPQWSADGRRIYFTVQERGNVKLMAAGIQRPATGTPRVSTIVGGRGSVGAFSVGKGRIAYAFSGPGSPAELFTVGLAGIEDPAIRTGAPGLPPATALNAQPVQITTLNRGLLSTRALADVESFTFSNEGLEIEAFLTKPAGAAGAKPASVPLIVMIHGGPHGQQGPAFNHKAQVYAGLGWATLMVNYRGSTGYGQALADAIFRDQNGAEARDVLAGVDAALARHPWLDANRMGLEGGSYGGQLTNWIITRTSRFKAAIPSAGISNLVTQNYLAYYHDYLAVEYGGFPHERAHAMPGEGSRAPGVGNDGTDAPRIIDMLWERSPIRYADQVKTPVLFIHGENDNDVPIEEAEQFYIALHDVGVETVMVRYPREGHGLRESKHVVDALERSIAWYRRFFR
ncbi:MAG: S9 family peptidase [Acidobacteria bacterium]|nr:S9 family peptidase [Acidobacteriota bacterium]